jgi:elongation factor P--(R)-beta-lysine ligase
MPDTPWWHPSSHADRRPLLLARNRIMAAMRAWFDAQGSVEVDPAGLQVSPGNETHLHAFATTALDGAGGARTLYLHTSPEFAMKKLLAAGEAQIHAFAPVWRNRERGPLHAPEFTMLEWYRAGADYTVLMDDCAALLALAARAAGSDCLRWRGATCDPFAAPDRITVADAFARHAGVDLMATIRSDGTTDRAALAAQAHAADVRVADDDTWSDILSKVLVARVEPNLGHGRATVLDRYPLAEAALARPAPDDPRLAERFELYACGVELANGFGELTDPAEQRRRFTADMAERARLYGESYPLDEDFLAALALMPPASGIALGFDRLVTLATGAPGVEAVMWARPG